MKEKYIRNNQPHIQPIGACYSVTLLVFDAIPASKLEALRLQRIQEIEAIQDDEKNDKPLRITKCHLAFESKLEALLSAKTNQTHPFRQEAISSMALNFIKSMDGKFYSLEAACIMSNHLHLLLDFSLQVPKEWDRDAALPNYEPLSRIIGRIKGGISYQFNQLNQGVNQLWAKGYYDRYIRSVKHFNNERDYIVNNPVKAGIVKHWQDYPYTYLPKGAI